MIQLNQIRCFVVVARELNFGRAAERLNMTQPPLSRQIQQLEKELGVRLLDRDRRGVVLTAAGQAFLPEAEYLLQSGESAALAAQSAFAGNSGRIVIGHIVNCAFLPEVIAAAAVRLPEVQITLHELRADEQMDMLREGAIDLALVPMDPAARGLAAHRVCHEPFVAAVPEQHPLSQAQHLRVTDFHAQPLIMYPPGSEGVFHDTLHNLFAAHGAVPRYVQFIRHFHSILALVNLGVGLALLPASASRMQYPHVGWRPLEPADAAMAPLYLVWREKDGNDEKEHPVAHAVRRLIISLATQS